MITRKNIGRKSRRYAILAGLLILILMGMGTFAWYNGNKTALNAFEGFYNNGVRLHDDFEGEINQKINDKDVYVENYGNSPLLIRVQFSEYYEVNGQALLGGQKNDITTWETHLPGALNAASTTWKWNMGGQKWYLPTDNLDDVDEETGIPTGPKYADADNIVGRNWYESVTGADLETKNYASANLTPLGAGAEANPFGAADAGSLFTDNVFENRSNDPITWDQKTVSQTLPSTVMTMAAWKNAGSLPGPYWVLDDDGWYYWAQELDPGAATGLLLNGVDRLVDPEHDFYYGIYVTLQSVSRAEIPRFGEKGNTISDDGKNLINTAAKTPVVSGSHGIEQVGMNEIYYVPRFPMFDYDVTLDFQMPDSVSSTLNTAKWTVLSKASGGFNENSIRNADGAGTTDSAAQIKLKVPRGSETSDITLRATSLDDPNYYIDFSVEAIDYVNQVGGGGGGSGLAIGGYANGMVGPNPPMSTDNFRDVFEVTEATKGWYAVLLRGGDGGNAAGAGGAGGVVKAMIWLEPNKYTLLAAAIGSTGGVGAESNTIAFMGGGRCYPQGDAGGGGGGLSGLFITDSTNYIQPNTLLVAGGGGGGPAKGGNQQSILTGGYGGGGGNATTGVIALGVTSGQNGQALNPRNQNGGGGGTSGGGAGDGLGNADGNPGGFFRGGDVTRYGTFADRAGAGGSGWYGGGSGGGCFNGNSDHTTAGGGGGGSSWVTPRNAGQNAGLIRSAVGGHAALSANLQNSLDQIMPAPYVYKSRKSGVAVACYMGRAYPDATLYP